jgi:hypothetical protein
MKDREQTIAFAMNYCQHYNPQGIRKQCRVGADIKTIQCVVTKPSGLKWGPCIEGHLLPNATELCSCWLRTTREQGEARADMVEKSDREMRLVMPVVSAWRKRKPIGKAEVIECPVCKGRLHLRQAACNGHVHGCCETKDCVNWME